MVKHMQRTEDQHVATANEPMMTSWHVHNLCMTDPLSSGAFSSQRASKAINVYVALKGENQGV